MLTEEIWKDVEGYEKLYQVSNLGRVRSLGRDIIRIPRIAITVPATSAPLPRHQRAWSN